MHWRECPVVDLELGDKPDERYRCVDPALMAAARTLLAAISAQIPAVMRPLADAADRRTSQRFGAEARALASRHQVDWRDVMLANISYDLLIATAGCSTIALPTPNGPLVARNMDWAPERLLAQASCLLRCLEHGVLRYAHAGWTASMGVVTGVSAKGFGLVLNAVASAEGGDLNGYPVLLFLRKLLEDASDFDSALKLLTTQRLACSGLITLVGERNEQRVVVERTPTRHALRWGEPNTPLCTTNHYRLLEFSDECCGRYLRLRELLNGAASTEELSETRLLTMLSDPAVIQEITAQHVLFSVRERWMKLFVPSRLVGAA